MKYELACRSTGMGAHTTMRGKIYDQSKTGNHWMEVVDLNEGEEVGVTDISNSGKHNCCFVKNIEGKIITRPSKIQYDECEVCDSR